MLTDALLLAAVPQALQDVVSKSTNPSRGCSNASPGDVAPLSRTGKPMLLGTDVGSTGVFQGYLGQELFTWAMFRSATTNAACLVGYHWGVEPGDEATLVVSDTSSLEFGHQYSRLAKW